MQFPSAEPNSVVDLRSDTLTLPTETMYMRMRQAPIGDDSLDGDPTVQELEAFTADLLGKEASLFVPNCTMANLLGILSQVQRAEQIIVEEQSHIYNTEYGSSIFTGALLNPVAGISGMFNINALEETISSEGRLPTSLICMETSHNIASGTVVPLENMALTRNIAGQIGASMHLDGARLFNAAIAQNIAPAMIADYFDTVSLCLSKELSTPAGALLVGSARKIKKARNFRRIIGGAQRQVGILAAAGLEAVDVMPKRLINDHISATHFAKGINDAELKIVANCPETNIVQIDVSRSGQSGSTWIKMLKEHGVCTRAVNHSVLRCVTHRHINLDAIDYAVEIFRFLATELEQVEPAVD